jgi:hypothetical protein
MIDLAQFGMIKLSSVEVYDGGAVVSAAHLIRFRRGT